MTTLSDEILLAYADDELPPAERAAVERRLAYDAEARDRLQAFTTTGQWLARAYDDTLRAPPPPALVEAIRAHAGGAGQAAGAPVPRPRWRLPGWLLAGPAFGGLGVAAGVALMVVLQPPSVEGGREATLLDATLETAASGETRAAEIAGERFEITPVGTVRVAGGGICREFTEIRDAGEAVTHGIACRAEAGDWRQVARIDLSAGSGEAPGFALASGDPQAVFDALLDSLGTSEILTPDAERALLEAGWH